MGTRADFYDGIGAKAKWLGSIAWDGYPAGLSGGDVAAKDLKEIPLLQVKTPQAFRKAVKEFLAKRGDATLPKQGWPWPWDDSRTTDYAYAFDPKRGKVVASCFGSSWYVPTLQGEPPQNKLAVFPNMKAKQKITFGARSGLLVVRS